MSQSKSQPNWQWQPIQSFSDFAFGGIDLYAKPKSDLAKWNNRIVQNLLYYQTNYFCSALICFGLMIMWQRSVLNAFILAVLFISYLGLCLLPRFSSNIAEGSSPLQLLHMVVAIVPVERRHQTFIGVVIASLLLLFLTGGLLNALQLILVPIFLVLVHASLRKRTLANRMANKLNMSGTPMAWILATIDNYVVPSDIDK